jgi:hypothetical protein
MADVTRSAQASMDTSTGQFAPHITGNLYAGEALDVAAPCYIKGSDGKVYMTNGSAVNEAASFDGFTPRACKIGEPVSLFGAGARFRYATAMTPGTKLYASTTAGRLSDTTTTGGTVMIAKAISATDIRVVSNGL